MPSRMEKYYSGNESRPSRSSRNTELYRDLYESKQYSNVEGIATIEKKNEIDLIKIQELLKAHEELKQDKKPIVKRPVRQIEEEPEEIEEKNYDIMDVLNKAKDEYNDDNKSRSLKNTQYNILKNINVKEVQDDESLKDLINTITSTSVLNKMGDRDLSLNLLEELKSNDNTMVGARGSNEIFKKELEPEKSEEQEIDKSFYTSSLGFREEDFEQLNDIKSSLKKNNVLITILVFFFLVVVITGVLFVFYNLK